jgi:hypothetical protein
MPLLLEPAGSYFWKIMTVCSEIHMEPTNTVTGETAEFFNVKPGCTQQPQAAFKTEYHT